MIWLQIRQGMLFVVLKHLCCKLVMISEIVKIFFNVKICIELYLAGFYVLVRSGVSSYIYLYGTVDVTE